MPPKTIDYISDRSIDTENIEKKIEIYNQLLKRLLNKCKTTKNRLDMYQNYLRRINTFIQLSVIYLSAGSTFIQALSSKNYEVIFAESSTEDLLNNSTDTITSANLISEDNVVDQDTYTKMVPIITLSITTYASLIIAGARHIKIEEREGNVSNLKDRFAELINRIKYHIDIMKPWENKIYYHDDKSGNKLHEWIALVSKIEKEYSHIVDIKRELFISYERIIDTAIYRKYRRLFHEMRKDENELDKGDSDDEIFLMKSEPTTNNIRVKVDGNVDGNVVGNADSNGPDRFT